MKKIKLIPARYSDALFVLLLRNEDVTRKMSIRDQNIIPKGNHLRWFRKHFREYSMIKYDHKKIGYLRLDKDNMVSIALLQEYRGKKIGQQILKRIKGNALIRIENKSSLYAFTKAGFKLVGFYMERNDE